MLGVIYCCCLLPWCPRCAAEDSSSASAAASVAGKPFPGHLHYLTEVKIKWVDDIWFSSISNAAFDPFS